MKKLTTALLGLLILFSSSCRLIKPSKDMGYDFVATLFNGKVEADGMRYLIKNLDGTIYNSNVALVDGGPSVDSALGEKIFVFYWANEAYGFFCKKPEEGKPLQILIGDEWKTIEPTPQIKVDSTRHFFTKEFVFLPIVDYGQDLPIAFYPTPKEDPAKRIILKQDKQNDVKVFFIRDIQGEWMKLQLCVDLSSNGLFRDIDSASYDCEFRDWNQLSKVSKDNPTYWIRWRDGSKVLIPQDYLEYRDVEC